MPPKSASGPNERQVPRAKSPRPRETSATTKPASTSVASAASTSGAAWQIPRKPRWRNAASALVSAAIHGLLIVLFGLLTITIGGRTDVITIAALPDPDTIEITEFIETIEIVEPEVIEQSVDLITQDMAGAELVADALAIGGLGDFETVSDPDEDLGIGELLDRSLREAIAGDFGAGAGSAQGGLDDDSFTDMVAYARSNGLDVVLVFDSTGSMGGEIETIKTRILQIGGALLSKVPNTRIGVVTYRDRSDDYVVKGLTLTKDMRQIFFFLSTVSAGGGGDHEEAVEYGIKWALANNAFRKNARKVVLLFGDAPPHAADIPICMAMASEFHEKQYGLITTVTCRNGQPLPELEAIAKHGGGEALTLEDPNRIMEELLVLTFGDKHRENVLEFFGIERPDAPDGAPAVDGNAP